MVVTDSLPTMDASSAVFPTVRVIDDAMVLAYHRPGCDSSAVLRFSGVLEWYYGPPNDEGLPAHPMSRKGVTYYAFHQVHPAKNGRLRWIATFHDGTFIVRALAVETVCDEIGSRPWEAIDATHGEGVNQTLDAEGRERPEVLTVPSAQWWQVRPG